MRRYVTALPALALMATAAHAATWDMTGSATGVSQRDVFPIAEGHMAMNLDTSVSAIALADDHPFMGMDGSCNASMVVQAPAASGSGICVYSNGNGDTAIISFEIAGLTAEGGLFGSWIAVGGTGAMSGVTGGGGYVNSATDDAGAFSQTVTGAITLPE